MKTQSLLNPQCLSRHAAWGVQNGGFPNEIWGKSCISAMAYMVDSIDKKQQYCSQMIINVRG